MSDSFDPDGLWIKSKLFINRALDPYRSFDEQAFWACTSIELLGKSALARVSPLLIANPMDDGSSLLAASGLLDDKNATSVPAKAVWSRCQRAFSPFNANEAKLLSRGRNEYIHAADMGFDAIPESAWWPRYWSQVVILLHHMDFIIEDFVEHRYVKQVDAALATRKEAVRQQLEARVTRARTMLKQSHSDTLSARQRKEWESKPYYTSGYVSAAECPACSESAELYGDEIVSRTVDQYEINHWGEYEGIQVTLLIAPSSLYCGNCRLTLADFDLLSEAGLDDSFEVEGSADDIGYEPEYNNE